MPNAEFLSAAELRGLGEPDGPEFTVTTQFVICRGHAALTPALAAHYAE